MERTLARVLLQHSTCCEMQAGSPHSLGLSGVLGQLRTMMLCCNTPACDLSSTNNFTLYFYLPAEHGDLYQEPCLPKKRLPIVCSEKEF